MKAASEAPASAASTSARLNQRASSSSVVSMTISSSAVDDRQAIINEELKKAGTVGKADAVSTNKLGKQAATADIGDEDTGTSVKARKSEKVCIRPQCCNEWLQ